MTSTVRFLVLGNIHIFQILWPVFGIGAILGALCNLALTQRDRDAAWFRFGSLALTALTVCAFYGDAANRVLSEDWAGLMDIMPAMSSALWICVLLSILINGITLIGEKKNQE